MKSCWSCKHCINDYFNTGTLDCTFMDDMTEEEVEDYYCNHGGENCPYYKPYMTDAEIEAENKMMNEEGFLRLFEAMMGQAYEDASYKGTNEKRLEEKKDAILFIEKMKKDFAN